MNKFEIDLEDTMIVNFSDVKFWAYASKPQRFDQVIPSFEAYRLANMYEVLPFSIMYSPEDAEDDDWVGIDPDTAMSMSLDSWLDLYGDLDYEVWL